MSILRPTQENIESTAEELASGKIVGFPTETVYGLGCNTFDKNAIGLVYKTKGRPKNNPMIAHVLSVSWVNKLTSSWSKDCELLIKHFWPGPLTLVLPKKNTVPKEACGGKETIAIRCPGHPVAQQLLEQFGGPISAPSANKSGYISPTTAHHVENQFPGLIILDGGPCRTGIESTVLSMVGKPTILRPGIITQQQLQALIGEVQQTTQTKQTESPGTTNKHYSPKSKTLLCSGEDIQKTDTKKSVVISFGAIKTQAKHQIKMPKDPVGYATLLYAALYEADTMSPEKILIEQPPTSKDWFALQDRLRRCTSGE